MSVWFKSRLNPWYIWIPSNPNLYSTKIIMKMRWQTIASNVSIRTISPTATPLPKAYDCVAVYIAGRRTSLVVYGWWPQPPTKNSPYECVWAIVQHEIRTPGVNLSYNDSPPPLFVISREILHYMWWTQLEIFHIVKGFPFCSENYTANAYIYHRWDRIAWCVGVNFQREISTPGVLQSYSVITPFFVTRRQISYYMWWTIWIYFTFSKDSPFPENSLTRAYIHYWWDRITWCVVVIFRRDKAFLGLFHYITE